MPTDPTYAKAEIEANPVWHLAWRMSEVDNDNAPIGWSRYIILARWVLTEQAPKPEPLRATEEIQAREMQFGRAQRRYLHDTMFHLLVDGFLDLLRGRAGQPPVTIDDIDEAMVLVRKQIEQDRRTPLWTPPRF